MYPIALNVEKLRILLLGAGEKLHEREKKLRAAGARNLTINHQPSTINFTGFDIVMIVGFDDAQSAALYKQAKASGALVNVEDKREFCDFFFQSSVHRGDLTISVSTNGQSPGTAKLIREKIEEIFPAAWENYIDEITACRKEWKGKGFSYDEVNQKTIAYVKEKGWL